VESFAATAGEATQANNARVQSVLAALRQQNIPAERIRTVGFELFPEYARERPLDQEQQPRVIGYRARNTLRVQVEPLARAGAVIDAAIGAGANRVAGLNFELADPEEARSTALREAVRRARAEAETIAAAMGETLGPVQDVSTTGLVPIPTPVPMARAVAMEQIAVPIEPGRLEITAHVTVVYRLGPP
jgi:uncharacterized protein